MIRRSNLKKSVKVEFLCNDLRTITSYKCNYITIRFVIR